MLRAIGFAHGVSTMWREKGIASLTKGEMSLFSQIPREGVSKFKVLRVENQAISQVFWFWPIILPKGPIASE
jgi:hypothetical protein